MSLFALFSYRFIWFYLYLSQLCLWVIVGRLDPQVPQLGFVGGEMQPVPPAYTLN